MNITLLSGSLNPNSKSRIALQKTQNLFEEKGIQTQFIDLQDIEMEFCDGRDPNLYPESTKKAGEIIQSSDGVLIAMPVYCYSVSGPLKNFIDCTSNAFIDKPFSILSVAGSPLSYLSASHLEHILGFECKSHHVCPNIFLSASDFDENNQIINPKVEEKIQDLASSFQKFLG